MKRALFTALCVLAPLGAHAEETPAQLIEQYDTRARALSEQATGAATIEEIGTLRELIGQARAFVEARKPTLARRRLDLARAQIGLIEASIERARLEDEIRALEGEADARTEAATKARNEAFALEQRLAELERQARTTPAPTPAEVP